jgi:membrane peptidoglycan carboxypeptidase
VSNPEFPSSYRPQPPAGGSGGASADRRDQFGSRGGSGGGRPAPSGTSRSTGSTGRGENGSRGYQAAGTGDTDGGWRRLRASITGGAGTATDGGRQAGPSRGGRPWSRGDQDGRTPRGPGSHEESRGRPDAPRSRGRRPGQATPGTRGTSASRERYAAARQRYAARVGAGQDTGVTPGDAGANGTGRTSNGYNGNGYNGNGYTGNGYTGNGAGHDGAGHGGHRAGGPATQWAPDHRRPGRRHGSGADGGSRGGRERRKGDWWRHWTLKKGLGVAAVLAGATIVAGAVGVGVAYGKTPIPNTRQLSAINAASTVYFSDNKTPIGRFGTFDRQTLNYNQFPPTLINAVVAAEDKNFWHEGGISPTGILRAAYYDLTSSGGNLQGASTITQQLVRNYYANIGTAQNMSRKIKEIFVAQKLARVKSKAWIITQYLNTVYLGQGAYGVGAAAQTYFGLDASQLNQITPAQAAMVAAMIQSPSYYSPNPKAGAPYQGLVFRWHYVINTMVSMGTLSQQDAAKATFPKTVPPFNNTWNGYRGYIMQAVQSELEQTYGYTLNQINTKGLHIVTTFKKSLMNQLYTTVNQNRALMKHDEPPPLAAGVTVGCGQAGCLPKFVHIGAVLEQPGTGAILAMYSGANYSKNQYDDALQSRNQVGSSFKPYVLSTAVSQGMNVQTSQLNGFSPLWIPPDSLPMTFASLHNPNTSQYYEVTNDEVSNPNRPVTPIEATAMSLNTAYADLWHRVALNVSNGQHSVVDMARAFGVDTQASGLQDMRDEAGTALGQASLTVEEQATMIATLADGGVYHTPHVIKQIINGNSVTPARVVQRQVLTPDQAAEVDYAMSFDMGPMGTANGLGLTNGQTVIAKTGTTNLSQSAFFLGATQRDAMAVGMFVSRPGCTLPVSEQALCTSTSALAFTPPAGLQTLFGVGGYPGYGGQWPAIIWHAYFMKDFNSLPVQAWPALPANFGTAWNLVPPLPKPKPKPKPNCFGNGRRCHGPIPTPSLVPPLGGGGGGGGGGVPTVGGAAAGGVVATGILTALLPAGARRRPRRRRRGAGRKGQG